MLDLMRKKARSWFMYLLFGGLILVFIFFFGYSNIGGRAGTGTIAVVNGLVISAGEFDLAFENNDAYYRELFQGNIPEQLREGLRRSTVEQLINQKLLASFADGQGYYISDQELAARIRTLPYLQTEDGAFDAVTYRERFLPTMAQRYSINFEHMVREQMQADKMRQLASLTTYASTDEVEAAFRRDATRYTFEVTRIDLQELINAQKVADVAEGNDVAKALQAVYGDTKARAELLETYGLSADTVGPLKVREHSRLLGPDAPVDALATLFTLTPEQPVCKTPIAVDSELVVCRMIDRMTPSPNEWAEQQETTETNYQERLTQEQLERWVQAIAQQAKIARNPDFVY